MPHPKTTTLATSMKLSPRIRAAWEAAASAEHRALSNTFEIMALEHCKRHRISVMKVAYELTTT
ncbi:MAG: hypothetical protein ACYDEV_11500 [Acidiferrobacter sp.]